MHFTVERKRLVKMIEAVRQKMPGQKKRQSTLRLFACSARAFVSANGITAGEEALVFEDGGCDLKLDLFLQILKSYPDKPNITVQADERSLRLFTTTIPISNYSRTAAPPAQFVVGQVTDLGVVRGHQRSADSPD